MTSIEKDLLKPVHFPVSLPQPQSRGSLLIASYNVHFGKKTPALINLFSNHQILAAADIILLQEIEHHFIEEKSRAEKLAQALGYHLVYAPAQIIKHKGSHGLAILSRFPIASFEIIRLRQFELLFRNRHRIALVANLNVGHKILKVCNVHADLPLGIEDRISQLDPVVKSLLENNDLPIVFAGDLNTAPVIWAKRGIPLFYQNQRRKIREFFAEYGFLPASEQRGYTHRAPIWRMNLDSIFVKNLQIISFGVERKIKLSDHKPLWTRVRIRS